MKESKRLLELDVLRGVAALIVVGEHYTDHPSRFPYMDQLWFHTPFQGLYGVQLFFIISGFVIFMTLERVKTTKEFVVARFSRLYPTYWVSVLFTFTVVGLLGLQNVDRDGKVVDWAVSLRDMLINLTMFQSWFEWAGVNTVDGAYWTLTAELAFYAVMCLFFVTGLLKRIDAIALIWVSLLIGLNIQLRRTGVDPIDDVNALLFLNRGINNPAEILRITFLVQFAQLFMAGIMFYKIKMGRATWLTHVIIAYCYTAQLIIFWSWGGKTGLILTTLFFMTFYLFAYDRLRFIVWSPLVFLGTISYALYLVHQNAGLAVILQLNQLGINPNLSVLITIALAIGVAAAITFGVERPAIKWIRGRKKTETDGKKEVVPNPLPT